MIRIYGASDDLIEIEGITGGNAGDNHLELNGDRAVLIFGDKTGGVCVVMKYHDIRMIPDRSEGHGCWSAQIVQIDEGIPIPWPVTLKHRHRLNWRRLPDGRDEECDGPVAYSVLVEIDAPADTMKTVLTGWRDRPLEDYYARGNDSTDEGEE